jgi:hypothetical protein
MPAIAPQVPAAPTAIDAVTGGVPPQASLDQQRNQLQQFIGDLRTAVDSVRHVLAQIPAIQQVYEPKLKQLVTAIATDVAKQAPQQTDSSNALPAGGA